MAKDQKLILRVGELDCISCIDGSEFEESKIFFDEGAGTVDEAIKRINSGNYQGVLMGSLVLSNGPEAEKYNKLASHFDEFDNPPYIWRSGGLYIVEQACKKGLVAAVGLIAEDPIHLREAERLGAKCFSLLDDEPRENILKYFQSRL
ncbi:MAG: hypothetical protein OEL87_02810 [Nanoarchaeota archaeon]|nr:hypothetical protein [Nanoarchaeota archaeon]